MRGRKLYPVVFRKEIGDMISVPTSGELQEEFSSSILWWKYGKVWLNIEWDMVKYRIKYGENIGFQVAVF